MIVLQLESDDPVYRIRDAACSTLGKRAVKTGIRTYDKDYEYCLEAFIAKHSILRNAHFNIIDTVRTDVEHQLLRATKGSPQPYCQSKRPDWNEGRERLPDDKSWSLFNHMHTAESFMEECRQRLCFRAMKETRQEILEILKAMETSGEPFFQALAVCCVPNCVFQAGCPEGRFSCRWFTREKPSAPGTNLLKRYMKYTVQRRAWKLPEGSSAGVVSPAE